MADISPTVELSGDGSVKIFTFEALTTTNAAGTPIPFSEWADRSVQFLGTFGVGGTIVWEGSNDGGTTWAILTDPQGNSISKTSAALEQVTEITQLARPRVDAGDGTTSLKAYVVCRRQNNMRT